jgi:glycosyltransferase involved in cell wall biosynthesis
VSLKVLFLTPWYPDERMPHHGVFVRDQAVAVSRKHKVAVISSKVDYSSFSLCSWQVKESVHSDVKEYRLVIKRSLPFLNQLNYLLISIWTAWKVSRQFHPDIIHGNIAYPGAIWAYCLSRLLSRPYIVSDHTSRFTDNFRSPFHRVVTLFGMRRARLIVAVSKWAARNIQHIVHKDVQVIPNLIHVDEYSVTAVKQPPVHIGFLGGLGTDRKGLDILLKSIAPIRRDFILHIGGQGQFLNSYKEMAASLGVMERCRFHGFVDYVPDFMKQLHFFVSSSRMEAFGMVIVEAMACGLPVVTTNSGGPEDFMDDMCGRMVPADDAERLRETIEWMIVHYQTFDRTRIRQKAVDNYSPSAFLAKIDLLYHEIVQS